MIYLLVFFPGADGQKRKKSLRRKLDSLAKEKSKDRGMLGSLNTLVHRVFSRCRFSLALSVFTNLPPMRQRAGLWSPPLGQVNGEVMKAQSLFTGL